MIRQEFVIVGYDVNNNFVTEAFGFGDYYPHTQTIQDFVEDNRENGVIYAKVEKRYYVDSEMQMYVMKNNRY